MVVLLLGIIWGFKASVDSGLLTEPLRIALGFAAAIALLVLGHRQIQNERPVLGQVLVGGSISVLMITTFAMHVLYQYVSSSIAFSMNIVWIAAGIFLSHRYRSQALAILSSLAGCLMPFLVKSENPNTLFFVSYEVLLYGGFLLYAIRFHQTILYYVSTILLQFTLLFYSFVTAGEFSNIVASGAITQHFLLGISFWRNDIQNKFQYGTIFTSFAVTVGWTLGSFEKDTAEWMVGILSIIYTGCGAWRYKAKREASVIFVSMATFGYMTYILYALGENYRTVSLLLEGAIAVYLGYALRSKWQKISGLAVYSLAGLMTLVHWIDFVFSIETFTWTVLLMTSAGIIRLLQLHHSSRKVISNATAGWSVLLLFFLSQLLYAAVDGYDFIVRMLAVAMLWLGFALCMMWADSRRENKTMHVVSWVVYGLAACGIFGRGIDEVASIETMAWSFVAITFGTVLYLSRKHQKNEKIFSVLAIAYGVYLLIFATRITGLLTETYSQDTQSLSVSLVWMGYAIVLIILGMKKEVKKMRLYGVLFIFVTLLKVVFYDLPNVSMLVRAVLFIGLGGIGILVSRLFYRDVKHDKKEKL